MKSKIFIIPIVILVVLFVGIVGVSTINFDAYAATDLIISSATSLDSDGNTVNYDFTKAAYANNISITYTSDWDYIAVQIYVNNIAHTATYLQITDNTATYNVEYDGTIIIEAQAYSEDKIKQGNLVSITVYSDCTAPSGISADTSVFKTPTNTPFNFDYTVIEEESGSYVDLGSSYYTLETESGLISTKYLNNLYSGSIYIACNYKITFYIFDYANNKTVWTYDYQNFGLPVAEVPVITLSNNNDTYASQVTVSISWGAEYDAHPDTLKYYKVTTSSGDIETREYTAPFTVSINNSTVSAIYYDSESGAERQVDVVVSYIDTTAPSSEMLMKNLVILCDITEEKPFSITVTISDSESGINSVYLNSGEELTRIIDNTYMIRLQTYSDFTIYAVDNVGNSSNFMYSYGSFDNETVATYNEIYLSLDSSIYSDTGWTAVEKACSAFSLYMFSATQSSSYIAELCRDIDTAVKGDITISTIISSTPDGFSVVEFEVPAASTNLLLGDKATITISKLSQTTATIDEYILQCAALANYNEYRGYSVALKITDSAGETVQISGDILIKFLMPTGYEFAEIYTVNEQGELTQLTSNVLDGWLVVNATDLGEFYAVCKYVEIDYGSGIWIGDYFYSTGLILSAVGITLGVGVVIFVAGMVIVRMRANKGERPSSKKIKKSKRRMIEPPASSDDEFPKD